MADTIKIGNLDISAFKVGSSDCKIYLGSVKLYPTVDPPTPPTPTGQTPCYAVTDDISWYQDRTYVDVYDKATSKWYKLNNLGRYEQYGIFETGNSLSDFTYYDGKLVAVGTTEYQYSGSSWVNVGTYEDSSTTLEINENTTGDYFGTILSTTFKIPKADIEAMGGWFDMRISDTNGKSLNISIFVEYGDFYYRYDYEEGTVTDDGEYYNFELPTTTEIEIDYIDYRNSETVHIIYDSKTVSVEYEEKERPMFAETYADVTEMQSSQCPFVGKYGVVGNDAYQFDSTYNWVVNNSTKLKAIYNNNSANVIDCGSSTSLIKEETQPSYLTAANMTSAVIGDCVTSIGNSVFTQCTSLSSVTIGNSVTSIGTQSFYGCYGLTSVVIPSNVSVIGQFAFSQCSSLTSITIPDSVITIGNYAFNGDNNVRSLSIGSGVTSIGNLVFSSANLSSITVNSNNSVYDSRNNCNALIETSTNKLIKGCSNTVIPSGVTSIGDSAISGCKGLTSVTIPNSVTNIENYAFRSCPSLTEVTVEATTPPTLGSDVFTNTSSSLVIYVPSGSVSAYQSATNWSTYSSRIQAIPNS